MSLRLKVRTEEVGIVNTMKAGASIFSRDRKTNQNRFQERLIGPLPFWSFRELYPSHICTLAIFPILFQRISSIFSIQ